MMRVRTDWLLTPQRAALHEPTATLVIADVHLGHGRARRTRGDAVPELLVADDLAPLTEWVAQGARRLLIAGDLFEAGYEAPLAEQLRQWCRQVGLELVGLVPGNHDRMTSEQPHLPLFPEGCRLGSWLVLHGDGPIPAEAAVQGHEHPCLRLSSRVQAPCFLVSQTRIVLPAYSREAAGVNILHAPAWQAFSCYAVVGRDVLDFGAVGTLSERLRAAQRTPVTRSEPGPAKSC